MQGSGCAAPGHRAPARPDGVVAGAVLLVRTPRHIQVALKSAVALLNGEGFCVTAVDIVVCDEAVGALVEDQDLIGALERARTHGVCTVACGLSLDRFGVDRSAFPSFVDVVPNGIVEFFGCSRAASDRWSCESRSAWNRLRPTGSDDRESADDRTDPANPCRSCRGPDLIDNVLDLLLMSTDIAQAARAGHVGGADTLVELLARVRRMHGWPRCRARAVLSRFGDIGFHTKDPALRHGFIGRRAGAQSARPQRGSREIEAIVLSHGHFDHTMGLNGIAGKLQPLPPLVVHPHVWLRRRINIPGREPFELPTTSEEKIRAAGFQRHRGASAVILAGRRHRGDGRGGARHELRTGHARARGVPRRGLAAGPAPARRSGIGGECARQRPGRSSPVAATPG